MDQLLEKGLALYADDRIDEALACWHEILTHDPTHEVAKAYIQCHEDAVSLPSHEDRANDLEEMTSLLMQRMEERRYEDALTLLYAICDKAPHDRSVTRAIQILKKRLLEDYTKVVGSLEGTPIATARSHDDLNITELKILDEIDGLKSLKKIIEGSPLGRFGTFRVLSSLFQKGALRKREQSGGFELSHPPRSNSGIFDVRRDADITTGDVTTGELDNSSKDDVDYDQLVGKATEALLQHDYPRAFELFEACSQMRPTDRLVRYNLDRLRKKNL